MQPLVESADRPKVLAPTPEEAARDAVLDRERQQHERRCRDSQRPALGPDHDAAADILPRREQPIDRDQHAATHAAVGVDRDEHLTGGRV